VRFEVYAPGRAGAVTAADTILVVPADLTAGPAEADLTALRAFARAGGRLLGLGGGVAWLCAAGLLPGEVATTAGVDGARHVRVEGRATPFTWAIPAGRVLPVAPEAARARLAAPEATIAELEARGRVVLRACDVSGGVDGARPRAATVAGLADDTGAVVGLLAVADAALGCALGRQIRACLEGR